MTVFVGMAMLVASSVTPTIHLAPPARYGITALVLLVAGIFGGSAFAAFGRAQTTINPVRIDQASALVTTGIYSVTRNPMYVALTALLVALACGLSNAWLLLGPLGFALFTSRFQILPEERAMHTKFGDAFTTYCARVRRWL
ncbi:isoprenylcysteine carboxylmethyltransferase family protein [Sphingomonas sp. SUN019]|uniref:methyltransferase family protein n=1 Tax=Sphingomonas sp. SUN019 TaxID=2937788 RepID=UPI0021641A63|nr:isoprenylcysteine carboxylmethyltransferase family protein [Sphingomonas sp. SUN019]UVO49670.1 isoprenylcysteine carboxylmethyltransferase family protein [Sphingomonas sp. SUN019]